MNKNYDFEDVNELLSMFDGNKYAQLAYDNKDRYQNNEPYPYICIDNFLPERLARIISGVYPTDETSSSFKKHEHKYVDRSFLEDTRNFALPLKLFAQSLSSRSFTLFLERLTGIESLIPDPYFLGGGAMITRPGGFLDIHVDFNWNQKLQLWRRCNALFYLTPNWEESWGGDLELCDYDGRNVVKRVQPVFNRLVVFSTTNSSYHGQSSPLRCPSGIARQVFSAFYYSSARSEKISNDPHFTKYVDDDRNNLAEFDNSPYSDSLRIDYEKNIIKKD